MDRLDNEEIGMIWARHYPKRAENGSSRSLCLSLAMVIRLRARSMTHQSDWSDKLEQSLQMLEFPRNSLLRSKTSQRESGWESATKPGGFYSTKSE